MRFLLLLVTTTVLAATARGDGDAWVISKAHLAATGHVQVYDSTTGPLLRTSQLMPIKVKLALDGNAVDVTFDPVLSPSSEAWLKRQLTTHGKSGDAVLIPLAPSSIKLTLFDPREKKVVDKTFAGKGGGLSFSQEKPFTLRLTLPEKATPITA